MPRHNSTRCFAGCREGTTELEERAAQKKGKRGGREGGSFQPKRNVRKGKSRKR